MLVGLSTPSTGCVTVLGRTPAQSGEYLGSIGYLAQDVPLYRRLTAQEHIDLGSNLNRTWDAAGAKARLAALRVPMDRPISTLSGGQRAQVGLGMALAKRPELLLLDEPVAALDPLARHQFLASLTEAVADGGLSVVLSSHLLHDLERVCDHVILLAASRTQVCDEIDHLLARHRMLVGPRANAAKTERSYHVIKATHTANQSRLIVRLDRPVIDPAWEVVELSLEEIILAYMGQDDRSPDEVVAMIGAAR
jgi:ABC-2 type transport system ATP-binding protein